jgi:hypothetical protein
LLSIEGAPFCSGFEPDTQNPTPKGAPFYIASDYRTSAVLGLYLSGLRVNQALERNRDEFETLVLSTGDRP